MDCQLQSSRFQRDRLARGYYAPQLAWWMEFYPPEDIMILDSNEVTEVNIHRIPSSFFGGTINVLRCCIAPLPCRMQLPRLKK